MLHYNSFYKEIYVEKNIYLVEKFVSVKSVQRARRLLEKEPIYLCNSYQIRKRIRKNYLGKNQFIYRIHIKLGRK